MSQAHVIKEDVGQQLYALVERIFLFPRSITGNGVRQTLREIQRLLPTLAIHEVPSGSRVFDWVVPDEWNIRDAYVMDETGKRIIDWQKNNLHVVSYSTPVNTLMGLQELDQHLYSLPDQPEAIPYITSYYERRWGFCIAHNQRTQLEDRRYRVVIDSKLEPGSLTYGELIIPGEESSEVLLSTYTCHPSLANDNVSGPAITTFLARWLLEQPRRRHTYRIVFVPETIGAITYLSRNLAEMKRHVIAGFAITCVGDDRGYSFLSSRNGGSLADRVALHVLRHLHPDFVRYDFQDRGSDERQYCSPGVDLPVVSVMRTKYGAYPEYHTSLDDLSLVTPAGLRGSYDVLRRCIECIEANEYLRVTVLCEPQLGRRGLYPTLSTNHSGHKVHEMRDLIAKCDGTRTLLGIADELNLPMWDLVPLADTLKHHMLLTSSGPHSRSDACPTSPESTNAGTVDKEGNGIADD
jgi:aminopeptidase-like protein